MSINICWLDVWLENGYSTVAHCVALFSPKYGLFQVVFDDQGIGGDLGLGLEFDTSILPSGIKPDYNCEFKNEPGLFKLAGIKLHEVRDSLKDLHESTIERLRNCKDYRPQNLEKIIPKIK